MKRVCLIATASGCGKTTTGRMLAERLGVPFYELDGLYHGPLPRLVRRSCRRLRSTREVDDLLRRAERAA